MQANLPARQPAAMLTTATSNHPSIMKANEPARKLSTMLGATYRIQQSIKPQSYSE